MVGEPGTVDLRPSGPAHLAGDAVSTLVVSGPHDLIELREIVETATGTATWPAASELHGEVLCARLEVVSATPLLGLLLAMDGLVEDRSPWRTWRTTVDTVARRVEGLTSLTIEAAIIEPDPPQRV